MSKEEVHKLLDKAQWKFAKTMPKFSHWYSHRETWENDKDFCDVVMFIRENGIKQNFFKKPLIYYYYNGYKYWTMGNPLCYLDKTKTFILNKAEVK